jgi:hypothetical protein
VTETECPHSADDALEPSQNRLRNVNRSIVMPSPTLPQAVGSGKLAIDSRDRFWSAIGRGRLIDSPNR